MAAENERVLRHYLVGIKAEVEAAEAALADLRNQQRVLEQLLAREIESAPTRALDTPRDGATDRIIPADESVPVLTGEEQRWQGLAVTKAVTRVLAEASRPMSPAQIVVYLNSVGLAQKNSESVRGALAWLKRKGTAKMLAHAQWVLVGGSVDQRLRQEAPATSESSETDVAGRNGQDMHANSSNTESMSGQPLTDDAPAPMAGGMDSLKPAADPVLRWSKSPQPSIRDAVLTVIQPGEDVPIGVVIDRLKDKYVGVNFNRNSVSNELGRWANEGKLERPALGVYRVIRHANPPSPH